MNQLQLTNLRKALELVQTQPEKQINLSHYRNDDEVCGTQFCLAGLLGSHQYFIEQGFKLLLTDDGYQVSMLYVSYNQRIGRAAPEDALFGKDAFLKLFLYAESWEYKDQPGITHKQIAINRLQSRITEYEAALAQLDNVGEEA